MNATNYPYDLSGVTNSSNILEFIQGVNNLSGEWFMSGMLLAGFVVLFVSMRSSGTKEALVSSAFIIAVLSIFFKALEFISTTKVVIIMIAFAIIFVVTTLRKD